jgi:hypothetical protein
MTSTFMAHISGPIRSDSNDPTQHLSILSNGRIVPAGQALFHLLLHESRVLLRKLQGV